MPLDDPIEMHDYDRRWPVEFLNRSADIAAAFGEGMVSIHHVGSTSVPGLVSKPIIDISVAFRGPGITPEARDALCRKGYDCYGSAGVPGRTFFRLEPSDGSSAVHVHVFPEGHPSLARDLRFRDELRAHAPLRREYTMLKRALALRYRNDLDGYNRGKESFISRVAGTRSAPAQWCDLVVTESDAAQAAIDGGRYGAADGPSAQRRVRRSVPVQSRNIGAAVGGGCPSESATGVPNVIIVRKAFPVSHHL